MMNRRGANRGTNPRRNQTTSSGQPQQQNVRSVRRLLSGGSYTPSEMPPVITAQPWNTMHLLVKISVESGDVKNFTFDDIKTHIINQAGFSGVNTASINFDIRVQSVAGWMQEVGHISLYPFDFITGSAAEFSRIDSYAMKNMFARVGFVYPAHIQSSTFTTAKTGRTNIFGLAVTVAASVDICLHILWKGANTKTAVEVLSFEYPTRTRSTRHKALRDIREKLSSLELALDEAAHSSDSDRDDIKSLEIISPLG